MRVEISFIWKRLYKRFYSCVAAQMVPFIGPIELIGTNLHNILFSLVHFGMRYTLNIIFASLLSETIWITEYSIIVSSRTFSQEIENMENLGLSKISSSTLLLMKRLWIC